MLTDAKIRKAKPGAKPKKLADERGLFLLVTPTGGRWWRLKYRFAGKEKALSLGTYPDVTLAMARDARDEARRLLREGADPSQVRKRDKRERVLAATNSFEAVTREWLAINRDKWAGVTHGDTTRRFERYVFPEIGHRPISELEAPELLDMLRKVEADGIVFTAHKVANACGQVFRFGIAVGKCTRNPVADLRGALKPRPKAKPMAALSVDDLPHFLRLIEQYDGEEQTRLALRLLALTMVRTGELRGARWTEFDLVQRHWVIPAERMKNGQSHHVPLSRQAVETLARLQELNGRRDLVFPGRNPTKPMSKNTVLFALYRLGYRSRMTGHGFRAVASTILNEQGFRPDVIERQLAHSEKSAVRAAYHRSLYLEERRTMMQAWADTLDALRNRKPRLVAIDAVAAA